MLVYLLLRLPSTVLVKNTAERENSQANIIASVDAIWRDSTLVPLSPIQETTVQSTSDIPSKKRTAPPPSIIVEEIEANRELFVQPSTVSPAALKATSDSASPRREALDILDDLSSVLNKQCTSTRKVTTCWRSTNIARFPANRLDLRNFDSQPISRHSIKDDHLDERLFIGVYAL
ncbi:hypothetical protein KIN20_007469 [Parelaphostrongylus tenuis]|uniref:Uncharacterized protein n=1 Tax=Parelaphostrongylus tenuis TaxID=148309 RepID=A0AAD5QM24_PARTN|nr:hypothetical protein KIN20_007469 [Parelaphostrongylus tenuis]